MVANARSPAATFPANRLEPVSDEDEEASDNCCEDVRFIKCKLHLFWNNVGGIITLNQGYNVAVAEDIAAALPTARADMQHRYETATSLKAVVHRLQLKSFVPFRL